MRTLCVDAHPTSVFYRTGAVHTPPTKTYYGTRARVVGIALHRRSVAPPDGVHSPSEGDTLPRNETVRQSVPHIKKRNIYHKTRAKTILGIALV